MSEPDKSEHQRAALRSTQAVLEPLVALLLECGIGVGDATTVLRRAFVHAASGLQRGSVRPNVSRIASSTGLPRQVVASLLKDLQTPRPPRRGYNRAERVLQGWWSDKEFLDPSGRPAILPLRGAKRSFTALAKRYSGDLRISTLRDELLRVKAIEQLPDQRFEVRARTTATVRSDPEGLETLGERVRTYLETLLHNLKNPSMALYERQVVNHRLDTKYAAMLIRDFRRQIDTTASSVDDNLNDPRYTRRPQDRGDAMRLGVGIYFFESSDARDAHAAPATPPNPPRPRRRPAR
jgi:hypothetical protein